MRKLPSRSSRASSAISSGVRGVRPLVVDLQQRVGIALGQRVIGPRREHHAPRRVVLLHRAARVRTDLHGQEIANAQLRAQAQQRGGDAGEFRVGQFGEIAGAHHDFRLRLQAAQLDIARERGGEAKMDRIENGIEDEADFFRAGLGGGASQRGQIAMRRGDENGDQRAPSGSMSRLFSSRLSR